MEEQFIKAINEYKQEAQGDIYNGYTIKEYTYNFERVKLFEEKLSIMLPIVFEEMDEEFKKTKYPNENRPQIIKTSLDGYVNFTFSLFDVDLAEESLPPLKGQMKNMLRKIQPSTLFFESKDDEANNTKISWFDFKSFALDGTIYNLICIAPIGGKYLHCLFNCKFSEKDLWKPAMIQVVQSITDETKNIHNV